jgi:glycosyltransferase involved in cell wall biosynthesis
MPIYLDISAAVHRRAGLGRYAESLAHALLPVLGDRLAFFYNREQGIEPPAGLEAVPARTVSLGYKPWRMLVWLGQMSRVSFGRLVPDARLFHAAEHLLLPLPDRPTVLTVHDLIFRHLPEHHKPLNRWYLRWALPLYCRRADRIIAVSEATRQDLIEAYDLPPEKIQVIYEAAAPRFRPTSDRDQAAVRARYGLPARYLLVVGTLEPRKNLTRLLRMWTALRQTGEVPPLVLVGARGWLIDEFFAALARSAYREDVILPGYIADADLPAVYGGATAFVFPSLYEGFGLPPLEAMACGTPVACSNTSSMPEVVGDAALTFDPRDDEAMAEALRRIVDDADLQAELRERGLRRAAQFSWARAARETAALYRSLLDGDS